jgi:hypothetical protein
MLGLKSYIKPQERQDADSKLPKLMFEGLLLGGTGLGVLALIFEIAADAFSVAAYQTLLAIGGAQGYHPIAIAAFVTLSVMLFFGIVPAYKAGAYLRPNAGGSGPLVEAIAPQRMHFLSWAGTSLFFLDAVLTIIISSISAADVTMLVAPQWAPYRILLAEVYAFFIMAVLVMMGPKRAVPLFLIGGGAFTIFTLIALGLVGYSAAFNPDWAFLTAPIVSRLEETGVASHVEQAMGRVGDLQQVTVVQLFFRSMSSAMLGFSGYEVIPASGKHAARPKWKVINTALTLAAIFLIGTGVLQLFSASQWKIPATEGYSTLLIEYEIVAAQLFGKVGGVPQDIAPTQEDYDEALILFEQLRAQRRLSGRGEDGTITEEQREELVAELAATIAYNTAISESLSTGPGGAMLTLSGILLAIILLLAQGGGYIGGAAVAANAAQLGRLPRFFLNDRWGIGVIWGVAAVLIPVIREVVIVEAYYAFGFVSAFIITSTTVFFVREDVLHSRGIEPGSEEARSLKFAGLRGMIASYIMGMVLVTQKTDALFVIVLFGAAITLFQIYYSRGGFGRQKPQVEEAAAVPTIALRRGDVVKSYPSGWTRAKDEARQRGSAALLKDLIAEGAMIKFNVPYEVLYRLVQYMYDISPEYCHPDAHNDHDPDDHHEPSSDLEVIYHAAYNQRKEMLKAVEEMSHYGIFTFIEKYYHNWVHEKYGRDAAAVQRVMIKILFPRTDTEQVWQEYQGYEWIKMPEDIWQFCRLRYNWAKDQWPNLSDRVTTVWTLQELGLIPDDVDIHMVIAVTERNDVRAVDIHIDSVHNPDGGDVTGSETGTAPE